MRRVSVDEVFPMFHVCFPEVQKSSLELFIDCMNFYMYEDKAFVCVYPCKSGLIIQYFGILPEFRGRKICPEILHELHRLYFGLDIYGECCPRGRMHSILVRNGWSKVPINYVCPSWGDEPEDWDLDLLVWPYRDKPVNVLGFLTEFYNIGFSETRNDILKRYEIELSEGVIM